MPAIFRSALAQIAPIVLLALGGLSGCQRAAVPQTASPPVADPTARGEYLVRLGGCNDCHTAGYAASGGQVPKPQWLTGSAQGFLGPWGTPFPSNLRLTMNKMSEAEWLVYSNTFHTRPPMPDFSVRELPEADRRDIYRFVTSLGAAGTPAPDFLPPGQRPPAPYVELVLPSPAAAAQHADAPAASEVAPAP